MIASLEPSTLKRIGALPVQLTVTLAHIGSRFGALVRLPDVALLLFAALFVTPTGVAVLAASTAGALAAGAIAFTVAVIVLDTRT